MNTQERQDAAQALIESVRSSLAFAPPETQGLHWGRLREGVDDLLEPETSNDVLNLDAVLEAQGIHPNLFAAARTTSINKRLPAWQEIAFDGVPMFRGLALALLDARQHGKQGFTVFSGDRRESVINRFNKRNGTHLHSQRYLFRLWVFYLGKYGFQGAIDRGVFPANPPTQGSHLLLGDGVIGRVGEKLPRYKLGLDIVSKGEVNSCAPLVHWLNGHGYHAKQPYSSGSELHHMVFEADPTAQARRRS